MNHSLFDDNSLFWAIVVFQDLAHLDSLGVSREHSGLSNGRGKALQGHAVFTDRVSLAIPEVGPFSGSGQVDITLNSVLQEDWGDEDVLTEHELRVLSPGASVVREVHHERASEGTTLLLGLLHQADLVLGEFDVDLNEFLEEENRVIILVDLPLSFRDV